MSDAALRDKLRKFLKSDTVKSKFAGKIKKLFAALDVDNDGRITKAELQKSLGSIGFQLSTADTGALLSQLDIDNDGRVDYNELHKFLHQVTILESDPAPAKPAVVATGKGAALRWRTLVE